MQKKSSFNAKKICSILFKVAVRNFSASIHFLFREKIQKDFKVCVITCNSLNVNRAAKKKEKKISLSKKYVEVEGVARTLCNCLEHFSSSSKMLTKERSKKKLTIHCFCANFYYFSSLLFPFFLPTVFQLLCGK